MNTPKTILTITGSDGTGGSGVQADVKTITALGGYAVSAITSVTVQNTLGIQEFYDLPAEVVEGQMEAIINDVQPEVVKIGMLRRVDTVRAVARVLRRYRPPHIVYDPVTRSSRGDDLMPRDVAAETERELLPLCTFVVKRPEVAPHGRGNQFASAVSVFLSRGETVDEAVAHAREYMAQLAHHEMTGRAQQLYAEFLEAVGRYVAIYKDVAFYAEELNVGARYLAQVTRRVAGRSPKAIIDDHLTQELERLLLTTTKTVQELAYDLGFSSQAHLSKFFKKQRGLSPRVFRQQNQPQ